MAANKLVRRYWDACNWISLIAEDEKERADICLNILIEAMTGTNTEIVTSALTSTEVVKKRGYPQLTEAQETKLISFFTNSYILIHDVTRIVAENARKLSRGFGLRPNDAVHLATSMLANCDVFETWNTNDFWSVSGQVSIAIRKRTWEGQLPMSEDGT